VPGEGVCVSGEGVCVRGGGGGVCVVGVVRVCVVCFKREKECVFKNMRSSMCVYQQNCKNARD